MTPQLHVQTGLDKGKIIALFEGEPVLIGRSRHADVKLADGRVSRVHCEVELEDGQILVTDHDSSGTFVNGKKIAESALQPGDVLQVGETQMKLVWEKASKPVAAGEAPELHASHLVSLPAEKLHELSGKHLSHFEVGEIIARGQSGIVFRARDFKDDSDNALKVLFPLGKSNNTEVRRMVRSVKTMMPLKHPNLVSVRGAGKTGPYCWIAMELIEGESLSQVIQRIGVAGMLDWRHAFRVALHVAQALEFAHGHQVIHRNIAPNNVLLRSSDKTVKLGDMMLAKALEGKLAEQITRPGEMLGDVRYMAPERTAGAAGVDGRSDIYSLGALCYALLTGRPPFDGANLIERITRIRTAAIEPPKKYQMGIPDLFQDLVLKMLARRPEDRFQSSADLVKEIKRLAKFISPAS